MSLMESLACALPFFAEAGVEGAGEIDCCFGELGIYFDELDFVFSSGMIALVSFAAAFF